MAKRYTPDVLIFRIDARIGGNMPSGARTKTCRRFAVVSYMASDTGNGGDSGAAVFLMSVVANALLYGLLGLLVSFIYRRFEIKIRRMLQ
jgi:hypothetical protein